MKLLILGGTRFLGRHVVDAALLRGHELTLFNRGRNAQHLLPPVEQLIGDRDGGLGALEGARTWDAVIDTCGYVPRLLRDSALCLRERVGRYVFVSSVSVYADMNEAGLTESSACAALDDPSSENIARHYGALKAACERELWSLFGDRALIIRPGLIVGPHDPTGRLTYWPMRMRAGGEVLAPDARDYPVQLIDARDLADWMVNLTERGVGGCFNACGPERPLTLARLLAACAEAGGARSELTWVSTDFLAEQQVKPWTELPLWAGEEARGLGQVSIVRALSAGLRFRSLSETISDTLQWAAGSAHAVPEGVGLPPERERSLLEKWRMQGITGY